MITCSNISRDQAVHYHEEKREDYYHERGSVPKQIFGRAAAELGFGDTFSTKDFANALDGQFKSGVLPSRKPDARRAAFDCTFSAPKSVSLAGLVLGHKDVVAAHSKAVEQALRFIEDELLYARLTHDKETRLIKADGLVFRFQHDTSRQVDSNLPDPQLHDHCLFAKQVLVTDPDTGERKLLSLSNDEILKAQHLLDSVYKQVLSAELRSAGYSLYQTRDGFEIEGFTAEHLDQFSKRTHQILAYEAENKNLSHKQATLKTRSSKKKDLPRGAIKAAWAEQAKDFLPTIERSIKNAKSSFQSHCRTADHCRQQLASRFSTGRLAGGECRGEVTPRQPEAASLSDLPVLPAGGVDAFGGAGAMLVSPDPRLLLDDLESDQHPTLLDSSSGSRYTGEAAVAFAIQHFAEREATLPNRYKFLAFALRAAEYDISFEEISRAFDGAVRDGQIIVTPEKQLVFRDAANEEREVIEAFRSGRGKLESIASPDEVAGGIHALEQRIRQQIVVEREAALQRPLYGNEREDIKPQLTAGQRQLVEKVCGGQDLVSVVVGDAGTGKSTSLEACLPTLEKHGFKILGLAPSGTAVEALAQTGIETATVQRAFHDERWWNQVTEKTVIVVDESGLVDGPSMRHLIAQSTARGARLVLVGDDKQFGSVQRGRIFGQLVAEAETSNSLVRLSEMQRGRNQSMRQLHFLARDQPGEALDRLFETGRITAFATPEKRLAATAKLYLDMDLRDRRNALVLVGTNTERVAVNQLIRRELNLPSGKLVDSLDTYDLTTQQSSMLAYYEPGTQIRLNKKIGAWKKGELLTVVSKTAETLVIQDSKGGKRDIHPRELGGAVTLCHLERLELSGGDLVRFTAADKDKGVVNGDRGEVVEVGHDVIKIRLNRNEQVVSVKLDDHPLNLRYSYSQTGHSAQGATAKMVDQAGTNPNVIVCLNSEDPTVDHKSFYTNLTRAADQVHIVTDATKARQIADLREKITLRKEKVAALDLLNQSAAVRDAKAKSIYLSPATGQHAWQRLEIPADASRADIRALLNTAAEQYGARLYLHADSKNAKRIARIAGQEACAITFDNRAVDKVRAEAEARRNIQQHPSAASLPMPPKPANEIWEPGTPESTVLIAKPAGIAQPNNRKIQEENHMPDIDIRNATTPTAELNVGTADDSQDIEIVNASTHGRDTQQQPTSQQPDAPSELNDPDLKFIVERYKAGLPTSPLAEQFAQSQQTYVYMLIQVERAQNVIGSVDQSLLKQVDDARRAFEKARADFQHERLENDDMQVTPDLKRDPKAPRHLLNGDGKVAIIRDDKNIRVRDKSPENMLAAMQMAAANGWKTIEIRGGTKASRTEAWIAATLAGVEAKGYLPTEKEKQLLEARIEAERVKQVTRREVAERLANNPHGEWNQKKDARAAVSATDTRLQQLSAIAGQHQSDLSKSRVEQGRGR